jgi:beta-1,4-N-acetylglucosaminyltransferase
MKVLVVSSVGGHLTEVMALAPLLARHEVTLVVNDDVQLPPFPFQRVYRIAHAERDWRVLYNFLEAASILQEERPDIIVSTGAGPAVPLALLGKVGKGARIVFVESAAAVTAPTLTGRLMYHLSDQFFYQWASLRRFFPRGVLAPLVLG